MNNNTLVFKISDKNDFSKLNASQNIKNFIADLPDKPRPNIPIILFL